MRIPHRALAALFCAFIGFGSQNRAAAQNWTLSIPSTAPWFDTGIDIVVGQHLEINATGLVGWATGSPGINADGVGEGWDGTLRHPWTVLPTAIWLSMIGKIGGTIDVASGTPLPEGVTGRGLGFVGSSYSQDIATSGRLFLGFNDTTENFGDNSGAFSVSIAVVPEPSSVALLVAGLVIVILLRRQLGKGSAAR